MFADAWGGSHLDLMYNRLLYSLSYSLAKIYFNLTSLFNLLNALLIAFVLGLDVLMQNLSPRPSRLFKPYGGVRQVHRL